MSSGKLRAKETKAQTNSGEFRAAVRRPEHRTQDKIHGWWRQGRREDGQIQEWEGKEGRSRWAQPSLCEPPVPMPTLGWVGGGGTGVLSFHTAAVTGSGQFQCPGIRGSILRAVCIVPSPRRLSKINTRAAFWPDPFMISKSEQRQTCSRWREADTEHQQESMSPVCDRAADGGYRQGKGGLQGYCCGCFWGCRGHSEGSP